MTIKGDVHYDAFIDAQGLSCPMPLLKAKLALNALEESQSVRVLATDKASVRDFHAFSSLSGNTLIYYSDNAGVFEFILQKGSKR